MYRSNPNNGIAWVTGASSGIGRAVAIELANRGYIVAATSRSIPELNELYDINNNIKPYPCDINNRIEIKKLEIGRAHV